MSVISPQEIKQLCVASSCDPKTVRKCYRGANCQPATFERLKKAAQELSLPLPPTASEGK